MGAGASGIGTTSIATTDGPARPRAITSISVLASTPCVSTSGGRVIFAETGNRNGRLLNAVA